jgi:hypothetical protein
MQAMVVYESYFGNTEQVARAIGDGLRKSFDRVDVVEVGSAPARVDDVDLVVVGGPTHAFGMSRENTREDARKRALSRGIVPASAGIGVRDWIQQVEGECAAATFDTVVAMSWFPVGSAAKRASASLGRRGFGELPAPEHFRVKDTEGPLVDGELERARVWGEELAAAHASA